MARPYVKLFTLTGGGELSDKSEAHLRFIAETYGWINSHGGSWRWPVTRAEMPFGRSGGIDARGRTAGDVLRAHNPSIILTNYCNGSYSNQEGLRDAMQAERRLPLAIAVHHTGARLISALGPDETIVSLQPPEEVPAGQPPIYPFKASTTDQEHTADKRRYVAWLRLDDEVLRIDAARFEDGLIRLSVRRGTWGTPATPHGIQTPVLQPVYCGSLRPDGGEYYLSGLPDGTSPQPALRYVFMQQRRAFWDFLAERIQETLDEGLDGPWLDCAVSSWINHANAYGVRIKVPYDLDLGAPLDRETHREYQQRKLDHLAARFPGGALYVNWFFPRHYFANGHERLMFSGQNGYRPIAGGAIEMYANEHFMDWHDLMAMHLDMRDRRFRVVSWIKRADVGKTSDRDMPAAYQLFGYATHLLVYEPDAPLYFGAAWPARGTHGIFTPPDFVYLDLGEPLQRFGAIAEAELPETPGVYARRFTKGMVMVNPDGAETRAVSLSAEYVDVRPDGTTSPARSAVTLPPRTACLLLASS